MGDEVGEFATYNHCMYVRTKTYSCQKLTRRPVWELGCLGATNKNTAWLLTYLHSGFAVSRASILLEIDWHVILLFCWKLVELRCCILKVNLILCYLSTVFAFFAVSLSRLFKAACRDSTDNPCLSSNMVLCSKVVIFMAIQSIVSPKLRACANVNN